MSAEPRQPVLESDQQWTVRRMIEWTTEHLRKHGSETPRLDAEILLAHSRGCPRIELYTRFDEVPDDNQRAAMRELVKRRAALEPVAYLVGHREFYALDFAVNRDVLIPRPETETLVLELLEGVRKLARPRILDVGTGSGCMAIAAAVNCQSAGVLAIDSSEPALDLARSNALRHNVSDRVTFRCGDLLSPVNRDERFDVIVSNPPYVAEGEFDELQPDIRLHEPRMALVAGPDGLDVIRALIDQAAAHLAEDGHLLLEISPEQREPVMELMASTGSYADVRAIDDLSGRPRVVRARRSS